MFSKGSSSCDLATLKSQVDDLAVLERYFGIGEVPVTINSPFRTDRNPSFSVYLNKDGKVRFKDFSTGESGDAIKMLQKLWNTSFKETLLRLANEDGIGIKVTKTARKKANTTQSIDVKVRKWQRHDAEYWEGYGVSRKFLKIAEVYPISHIFFVKEDHTEVVNAQRYAYVYVERRGDAIYKKVYQPLAKNKRDKWFSKMSGIISLYTKIPDKGEQLVICSSLKDALCLWENTGMPCIALQGEGYSMKKEIVEELKSRFVRVCVLFDNDEAGLADAEKLCAKTGFENIVLPCFDGGKDVSDLYKAVGNKEEFNEIMKSLIK